MCAQTPGISDMPGIVDALTSVDATYSNIVCSGVKLVCECLVAAEANYLCGASLDAPSLVRDDDPGPASLHFGWRNGNLRTPLGKITLRLPRLRCLHSSPSMLKRFRRLQDMLLATIRDTCENGVSSPSVETLIKTMWTVSLPADLLQRLTRELCLVLENWRKNPTLTVRFSVTASRPPRRTRVAKTPAALPHARHAPSAAPSPGAAGDIEIDGVAI